MTQFVTAHFANSVNTPSLTDNENLASNYKTEDEVRTAVDKLKAMSFPHQVEVEGFPFPSELEPERRCFRLRVADPVKGHYHSGVRAAGERACHCNFHDTDGIPEKSVVKFAKPVNESEADSRMIVLENRGPRTLVVDCAFVNNPDWPIPPTSVYATEDLALSPLPTDPAILIRLTVDGNQKAQTLLAQQLAESIKDNLSEILSDAGADETAKLAAVGSFADLHDLYDANTLGSTEEFWAGLQAGINPEGDEARVQLCCDVVNAAQTSVDQWIKAGGLRV